MSVGTKLRVAVLVAEGDVEPDCEVVMEPVALGPLADQVPPLLTDAEGLGVVEQVVPVRVGVGVGLKVNVDVGA